MEGKNLLGEHDLDSFMTFMVEEPTTNVARINYNKNQPKSKRIIYDSMKDNLVSMITQLKKTKECFETLTNLYEKKYLSQKRALKKRLCNLNMEKDETEASFFSNISQVRDQLASIIMVMDEGDQLQTTIDGLPSSWETFLAAVNGRE